MTSSFVTERTRAVLWVPFLYAFFSRMQGLRGFGFNAATLWVPGGIITASSLDGAEAGIWGSVLQYAEGYLVFICVYELGYIMNDTWGLRHDTTPRRRIQVNMDLRFVVVFVAVRVAVVALIAGFAGYLFAPWFLAIMGALIATLLLHNLLSREEFKLTSFLQMSLLRFCTPIFVACHGDVPWSIVLVAFLLFTFPRFLTYQDAKARLRLPERKLPLFGFGHQLCVAPLIGLMAWAEPGAGFLYAWAYCVVLWGLVFVWSSARAKA